MAQLVARFVRDEEAASSSLASPTSRKAAARRLFVLTRPEFPDTAFPLKTIFHLKTRDSLMAKEPALEHPRVTFAFKRVMRLSITGDERSNKLLPEDGGLVARFLKWKAENGIALAIGEEEPVPGLYVGFYSVEDAEKISAWLFQEGAKEVR